MSGEKIALSLICNFLFASSNFFSIYFPLYSRLASPRSVEIYNILACAHLPVIYCFCKFFSTGESQRDFSLESARIEFRFTTSKYLLQRTSAFPRMVLFIETDCLSPRRLFAIPYHLSNEHVTRKPRTHRIEPFAARAYLRFYSGDRSSCTRVSRFEMECRKEESFEIYIGIGKK